MCWVTPRQNIQNNVSSPSPSLVYDQNVIDNHNDFFCGSRLSSTKACILTPLNDLPAALLYLTFPLTCYSSSPPIWPMVIAKMSIYKRIKLACCFDCGRSERDCSCMSGSVHSNMDTLERAFPLSSVSVNDCSTSLRACKFLTPAPAVPCLWCLWYHPCPVSYIVVLLFWILEKKYKYKNLAYFFPESC